MNFDQRFAKLRDGELDLERMDLDHKDLKRVLTKLNSGRSQPPRKCRRLNGDSTNNIERFLSSGTKVRRLRLAGNMNIGDKGMDYLQLIPSSVNFITLSFCNISTKGIKKLCKFLETNKTIVGVMMWGNCIDDEGAHYIAKMLKKNTGLGGLSCREMQQYMSENGMATIAESLKKNRTIRVLDLGHNTNSMSLTLEEKRFLFPFESMLEVNEESALTKLAVCAKNEDEVGSRMKIKYFMELNKFKARKITRDSNIKRFYKAIEKAASSNMLDATYFLLRNNVQHFIVK